jgi:phosphatidylglycerol lysyltransferase
MSKKKLFNILLPVSSAVLFSVALWVLFHELRKYHLHDVAQYFHELPALNILLAVLSSGMGYFILTLYDTLGLQYIKHSLEYKKIALASYIGYAFSNSIGYPLISGSLLRYRLYSTWGLSAVEVAKVVTFCSFTSILGFLTVAGCSFILDPETLPSTLHLPMSSVQPFGYLFLGILAVYFCLIIVRRRPVKLKKFELQLPHPRLSAAQVVVGSLDWVCAGGVLYFLLPKGSGVSYPGLIGLFMLSEFAGMVSRIPGGLGVFEMVMVLLLPHTVNHSQILGALVSFRIIYYFMPLAVAAVVLGCYELLQKKAGVRRFALGFGKQAAVLIPYVFAVMSFLAGVVLLFTGSIPAVQNRLTMLMKFLPFSVFEISHFLGSIVGIILIITAWRLSQRINAAYFLTIILLGAGIILSLFKGFQYEDAIILAVFLAALIPAHRQFYRRASLIDQPFTPAWFLTIFLVLLCSVWLGMFSYKHVDYSNQLWWKFSLSDNAPRFLRASVGALIVILVFAVSRLVRPYLPKHRMPRKDELDIASEIIRKSPKAYAALALAGDKSILFSPTKKAFLMYAIHKRSWVVLGDPVGPKEEWEKLLSHFRELSNRYNGWPVFYEVEGDNSSFYQGLGLNLIKFGEEGRVPLETFSLEGSNRKRLRQIYSRLSREGYIFEVLQAGSVKQVIPELQEISENWLRQKHGREKSFSVGCFKPGFLTRFPVAIIRKNRKIYAFANILTGAWREELSVDLMRYTSEAPESVMEYLFIELMLWGKKEGYRWFNLGMAPFSGLDDDPLAPVWRRIGTFIYRYGEHFYNFKGLRQYKDKFNPRWYPKYIATTHGFALPKILVDINFLVSGRKNSAPME